MAPIRQPLPQDVLALLKSWPLDEASCLPCLTNQGGCYLLLLQVPRIRTHVGALGTILFTAGLYGYVGSASGGSVTLAHRLARHLEPKKVRRWHIDFLTTHPLVTVVGAYWAPRSRATEVSLALHCASRFPIVRGFGNSDHRGRTPGHLFVLHPSAQGGRT